MYAILVPYVLIPTSEAGIWSGMTYPMLVPQEVVVDNTVTTKEALIGGYGSVHLTLEYLPKEGATSASIQVSVTLAGNTVTWQETPIAGGYHVKTDFSAAAPGSKVTVEATDVMARLRWCERVCC
ncbi:MAG: hypothetical protein AB7G48_10955 [Nitrospiraceae bacterium]